MAIKRKVTATLTRVNAMELIAVITSSFRKLSSGRLRRVLSFRLA